MGEWVAGCGAVVLFVSLFLPWYSVGSSMLSAWEAMTVDDVLLAVAVVMTLGALAVDATPRFADFSVAALAVGLMPAVVAVVLTAIRLADPAPARDASLDAGAWLAFAASLCMAGGLVVGMRDPGPARRGREREEAAAAAALQRAELLSVPGEADSDGAGRRAG